MSGRKTVGAIFGTLLVSFWLIPRFGTHAAQQVLLVVAGLSAALSFQTFYSQASDEPRKGGSAGLAAFPAWTLAVALGCAAVAPGLSKEFLAYGRYV